MRLILATLAVLCSLLPQKFPAQRFTVTAKLVFNAQPQEAGLVVQGKGRAGLQIADGDKVQYFSQAGADEEKVVTELITLTQPVLWVKLEVRAKAAEGSVPDAICQFSYSLDGKRYVRLDSSLKTNQGPWTGAQFGFPGNCEVADLLVKPEFAPLEGFIYDEAAVPEYTLPELLVTREGKPVKNRRDWEKKRRQEVFELVQGEYGTVPPRPAGEHFRVLSEGPAFDGKAIRKEVAVYLDEEETSAIKLLLYAPAGKAGSPCFLGVNFFGNHTVCEDPQISLPDTLSYRPNFTLDKRGSQAHRWPIAQILQRGYAVATFCCEDIAPDYDLCQGIKARYPGYTWGHLAAWGWGLSRALDYLLEDCPEVDGRRVAVFGHSRMGKAAVWAGARDTRFAMVISNASGCGGAAISRRRFGETVRRINTHFPYWFSEEFHQYNDREDQMPFDQHFLLALVAPRPLFVESGTEDRWSDPRGEELGLEAALPAYRLYDAEDRTAYGIRPGKHEILLEDWLHYLSFADRWL